MRNVVPVPRGDHSPLRAARSSLLVRLTGGTEPRRLDGTTAIRPSSPACATLLKGDSTHASLCERGFVDRSEPIHIEDEVKDQEDEVEDGRDK